MIFCIPSRQCCRVWSQQQVFLEIEDEIRAIIKDAAQQAVRVFPNAKALGTHCDGQWCFAEALSGGGAKLVQGVARLKLDKNLPAAQIIRRERF